MEQSLTFDLAIEILEIIDINKVSLDDLPKIVKKAQSRWHPDRISHSKDENEIKKYTNYFQLIQPASELIVAFLKGEYKAGEKFEQAKEYTYEEPADVIRRNASSIQDTLKNIWETVKRTKYKFSVQEVILSDGFKLKDLLNQDFKEDLAGLSVISFLYGVFIFGLLTWIGSLISPFLGVLIGIFWGLQALSCLFGFLPLSRFWLPEGVQNFMLWFINVGLKIYNWADRESEYTKWWIELIVQIPMIISIAIKYILLFPLYEIAKLIVGDKIVGIVKRNVNYYAGGAEWYIDDLINKNPAEMTEQELFDLSYLYSEFSNVKQES
ncbi:MAG: hypothetical protein GX437_01835 [Sphingobacteriales bacterium]|nr:hypothetical protein [Sphingobacteriales bacterium]